jgi:hypothetical protein
MRAQASAISDTRNHGRKCRGVRSASRSSHGPIRCLCEGPSSRSPGKCPQSSALVGCSCRTPPTRRFREVGAGCSAPALALLKYAYPAKIAIDARICLALCSREPEILGQYPHVAVEHRLRRLPVSLVSPPQRGGEVPPRPESRRAGSLRPDDAHPAGVSLSRRPATRPRYSPGWKSSGGSRIIRRRRVQLEESTEYDN